ncbi:GNAT family N-acetyltransferase [Vibrio sonorensis]|uniref:GNAT family N-acetyltransferase n=1 Tax=Vibrio sonorensis TaxID=1004316 RepID=UPI0008DABF78|nr:GNAT family N-acetyltransferase [Vibrio sonorensis]
MLTIRKGTLDEAVIAVDQIAEFINKETVASLSKRVEGKKNLVLVAEDNGKILGFKIGYQLDEKTFYSWFGGVVPKGRQHGIAQKLLDAQEKWISEQGYQAIRVKSRNQFPAMVRLLFRNGYVIEKFEEKIPLLESRLHFIKQV